MKALYDSGALSQAELEKVELELEKARTGLAQAKAQYDLAKEGPTPDTVAALEAEVERLNASLAMAKNGLANTQITAPISGVIAKRNVDPGEMATAGAPLLVLVKMDEVQVEASVPQERINQFAAGTEVDVRVIGEDGKVRKGKVEFVSPVADANSSSFPVKVRLDNRDGSLRAGMVAEISLAGETDQGIRVPSSAVVSKDGKQYVFTVEGDIVHQKEVSVSQTEGNWAVVSSGVTEGEQLVLNPTDSLSEGSKVIAN
jgi:RND family efflux transporter MFP subunit